MSDAIVGAGDLVGAETKDGCVHEVDGGLGEGVGEAIEERVDQSTSGGRE